MRIYEVQVVYPQQKDAALNENPPRYRGLLGGTQYEAIAKAQSLHRDAGRPTAGAEFYVACSRVVLCPTAVQEFA
jgi:hypothetical protein